MTSIQETMSDPSVTHLKEGSLSIPSMDKGLEHD